MGIDNNENAKSDRKRTKDHLLCSFSYIFFFFSKNISNVMVKSDTFNCMRQEIPNHISLLNK